MGATGWSVGLLQLVVASGSVFDQRRQQQQKPRPGILIILAFLTVKFSRAWHRTVARSFGEPSLRLLLRPRHRRVAPSCRSISVMTRRFGVSAADCSERGGGPSQSAEVGCRGGGRDLYCSSQNQQSAAKHKHGCVSSVPESHRGAEPPGPERWTDGRAVRLETLHTPAWRLLLDWICVSADAPLKSPNCPGLLAPPSKSAVRLSMPNSSV